MKVDTVEIRLWTTLQVGCEENPLAVRGWIPDFWPQVSQVIWTQFLAGIESTQKNSVKVHHGDILVGFPLQILSRNITTMGARSVGMAAETGYSKAVAMGRLVQLHLWLKGA